MTMLLIDSKVQRLSLIFMKIYLEYFEWHKEERGRLLMTNPQPADWKNLTRIMVMQCLKGFDYKCGGTADRTKPFLLALREAYHSKRFLVIHWTLPALLEEFLVPPEGGFDWRAPESLHTMVRHSSTFVHCISCVFANSFCSF
jgi:hypothetical protein